MKICRFFYFFQNAAARGAWAKRPDTRLALQQCPKKMLDLPFFERILMKICWDIEKDVPGSILEAPGADSGVKNQKNPKYVTQFFSKKSANLHTRRVTVTGRGGPGAPR